MLHKYVEAQSNTFFEAKTTYKNLGGESFTAVNSDILQQVFNHSTFHRGQIITLLRFLGFEGKLPSTDFISWERIVSN